MPTIYDELGGRVVVELVVDLFYQRLLADPEVAPYFADVDLARVIRGQCLFLAFSLGRLPRYDGHAIRDAHRPLKLTPPHFDAVAAHLAAALKDVGAQETLVARIMAVVATSRDDVLDMPPAP